MSRLREKDIVSSELVPAFNKRGCYAYKIPDPPSTFGNASHVRFTKKRPYDFVAAPHGLFMAGEAKLIKKVAAFGWGHLKEHQQEALDDVLLKGNLAYVFLLVREKADKEKDIKMLNRLYIFEYGFLKDEYERLGRNFKKKELEEMPFYVGFKRDYMIDDFLK